MLFGYVVIDRSLPRHGHDGFSPPSLTISQFSVHKDQLYLFW